MTTTQISLVKKSWRILRQLPPELVADTFYSRLFFDHPELRKMFPKQMDEQYKKLIDMLTSMVIRLDDLEDLGQELEGLAQRHVGYGVKPKHYTMVGEALLWTLEQGLGNDWDEATAKAWTECYTLIQRRMTSDATGS